MPSWPSSIVDSPLLPQPVNVNPSSSPRTLRKATMKLKVGILAALALTLAGTASAQWTPTKPGDPRVCQNHTPADCARAAAQWAFTWKYQHVKGHAFANTLRCSSTTSLLSYVCAWGSPAIQTPVRFAHKAAGWKASVGVIPAS